jgi:hypothetical protein
MNASPTKKREDEHSSRSIAEYKNVSIYTSIPPICLYSLSLTFTSTHLLLLVLFFLLIFFLC